ncbi:hypothetical protein ACFE04_022341 [Oxalis oulophora]
MLLDGKQGQRPGGNSRAGGPGQQNQQPMPMMQPQLCEGFGHAQLYPAEWKACKGHNLDKSIDHKALHDTFSAFGNILSCKVATDASGQSKGYGFVQFEHEESAMRAIENLNGMLLNEKQVIVGPFVCKLERVSSTGQTNFNNSTDDAARAVEALNGTKFDDRDWYVGKAQKKSEREAELKYRFEQTVKEVADKNQGANLYVKRLDDTTSDEKLKELFSPFGVITSCKVMRDPFGVSKGSGFVAF